MSKSNKGKGKAPVDNKKGKGKAPVDNNDPFGTKMNSDRVRKSGQRLARLIYKKGSKPSTSGTTTRVNNNNNVPHLNNPV